MESIRTDGVLQPILVRPRGKGEEGYEVVEGNHRFEAVKLVGLETLPCMIMELTDHEVLIIQLKAQAVRPRETAVYEYSRRLRKLNREGYTLANLSALVDKSFGWVQKMMSLTRLSPKCVKALEKGNLRVTAATELATVPEHLQDKFLEDAIKMQTAPFIKRLRAAKRDYDAFLLDQNLDQKDSGINPKMRNVKDIMAEASTFEAAEQVLTSCNAITPQMGWKACLAWIMRVDPVTVANRKAGIKEKKHDYLTRYQLRQKQRQMIKDLTFDLIQQPGDSNE
jgi:ParB/RepB/Spo0J family partition protein